MAKSPPGGQRLPELSFDNTTGICLGKREHQEDALASDFPMDGRISFAVLADGMGGHAAGEVASTIVVTEVFSELKFQSVSADEFKEGISRILRDAALGANACVKAHASANPETGGMGATLLAPVFIDDHLFWISVGDSPLYLIRNGEIRQLNEDHSLAPQIDFMVKAGMIDAETGRNHPDRNCLTSVLVGDAIDKIDCPDKPLDLLPDDIVIAASDGLQFLDDEEILEIATRRGNLTSAEIVRDLLSAVIALEDPYQDNTSLCVTRVKRREDSVSIFTRPRSRRRTAEIVPLPLTARVDAAAETGKLKDRAEK